MIENKEWFKDWFASDYYQSVYKHRDNNDAKKFINFIFNNINFTNECYILDAACGAGRHLKYLDTLGYKNVFGFDLSLPLLKAAKSKDVNKIINADIRNVFFKEKFDIILNIFTSFGYFDSDFDNFLFFQNAKLFLKQKGIIIFDYFNSNYLVKNLVVENNREIDDITINEKRNIINGRVEKEINIKSKNNTVSFIESVKLYKPDYLIDKFTEIGYKINSAYGNYTGELFNSEYSERIILFLNNE
ncbi:MAG TPA: class I SAM-dependent methyltransferase [Melioribacteraceae bacterium]|nr:class I SAM-dependent methyltransferase [Melioribacteraceae bacterium]